MKNKVLVKVIIPDIDESYDIFIPISKKVGEAIILIVKAINQINPDYNLSDDKILYNRNTGKDYAVNTLIKSTDIRNGTNLILI